MKMELNAELKGDKWSYMEINGVKSQMSLRAI